MNKKRLSVVMAGAMLASAVAPVMAATPSYEVNGSNKGLLIRDLRNLLTSKVFANESVNNQNGADYRGESIYRVKIDNELFYEVGENDAHGIKALEKAIQNAKAGTVIEVADRGHVEKNGKYYAFALENMYGDVTYTADTLKKAEKDFTDSLEEVTVNKEKVNVSKKYPSVYSMNYDAKEGTLTVTTRKSESENTLKKIVLKAGDKALDFEAPIDKNEDLISGRTWDADWSDLEGYKPSKANLVTKGDDLDLVDLAKVTVTNADEVVNFKLSELYDGLLLTEKGQELLDGAKLCKADKNDGYKYSVGKVNKEANGLYTLAINFYDQNDTTNKSFKKVVKITTNNEAQLTLFKKWMVEAKAQVEVLAGDNRYETAVKVAKENADIKDVAENGNIVLVNGNALVDGLAAAPLAATVWNKSNTGSDMNAGKVAPILLTESNELPKATKEYIKELIAAQRVGNLDKVTIYLVGGTSVLSKGLENNLKDLGLRVVRAGGDNREETSLKVAELMQKENGVSRTNAFLVGANGEADAMSIASVAAEKRQPIIVESNKGISEDTIEYLKGYKASSSDAVSATIIGGESVVSKATEETLKAEKISVDRVFGSNRQKTNAEVINRFAHSGLKQIVISKDGQNNKSELIDALTATSLAVKHNAPIVLGTNKLANEQINAIEKKAQRTGIYVYQVGHGVSRDVLKTIAERVGLAK